MPGGMAFDLVVNGGDQFTSACGEGSGFRRGKEAGKFQLGNVESRLLDEITADIQLNTMSHGELGLESEPVVDDQKDRISLAENDVRCAGDWKGLVVSREPGFDQRKGITTLPENFEF